MYEILNFLKGGLIDNYWYALLLEHILLLWRLVIYIKIFEKFNLVTINKYFKQQNNENVNN